MSFTSDIIPGIKGIRILHIVEVRHGNEIDWLGNTSRHVGGFGGRGLTQRRYSSISAPDAMLDGDQIIPEANDAASNLGELIL